MLGVDVLYVAIKRKYDRDVQLRYNYRLSPTPDQCAALVRAFGCARVVFNDALRARQDAHAVGCRTSPTGTCRRG
jgi:transposase